MNEVEKIESNVVDHQSKPEWIFDIISPGTMERNPVSEEFFANDTQLESIVRESIQNSLDACADKKHPVRVRIYFSGEDKLSADKIMRYRNGGEERFNDTKNGLTFPIPSEQDDCQFVVIEDFNTTGLTGDISKKPINEDIEHRNDWNYYNYFFRENGSTKVGADTLGSWGAGKCVFQRASRLKISFAYSIRDGYEPRKFIVGKATHQNHMDDKFITWAPDGWFGYMDKLDPDNPNKMLKQPILDDDFIKTFISDFNLKRECDKQTGTSIVIPYIHVAEKGSDNTDFNIPNLVRAIIKNFLIAIYNNKLIVDVQIGKDGEVVTVDKDNLKFLEKSLPQPGDKDALVTTKHLELLMEALNDNFPESQKISLLSPGEKPYWNTKMFGENQIQTIKDILNEKKSCLISIPMPIIKKDGICEASFKLIIKRVQTPKALYPIFYRAGLLIDSAVTYKLNDYVAIVVIDEGPLANLLVATEPPSHNKWNRHAERAKKDYDIPQSHIDFVTATPKRILEYIAQLNREENWDPLSDVFGIKQKLEKKGIPDGKSPGDPNEGDDAGEDLGLPKKRSIISLSEINGTSKGVKIKNGEGLTDIEDSKLPMKVSFKIGYDTFSGLNWTPNDFELEKDTTIKLAIEDGSVKVYGKGNTVTLEIDNKMPFSVLVTGFDENRDISVANLRYDYSKENENATEV